MSLKNTAELFVSFQKGEAWAFRKIYSCYRAVILKYVRDRVRNQETAEELSQDIFLKAFRARASFQPALSFSTWLWTITRNTLVDFFRRLDNNHCHDSAVELPSLEPDAEHRLLTASNHHRLEQLLAPLTGLQRKALSLRLLHRLSYRAIAGKLGLSLSAVKCLVYRSKRVLGLSLSTTK